VSSIGNRLKAIIVILFGCAVITAVPGVVLAQDLSLQEWVGSQLSKQKPERVTILDVKLWPQGPRPNTYVILALGSKPATPQPQWPNIPQETRDFVVFLVESDRSVALNNPRLIASHTVYSFQAFANGGPPRTTIDVGPYQIREDEYAFGIRTLDDISVGNKGGLAFEEISLFRYQASEIKQVLDDVTWGYSKYSEPEFRSCNTETVIVSEPPKAGNFFTLVRRHVRSYLGDTRM